MVRAVVFDVGHVLYDWDPRYLYAKLIHDAAELDWFLANVVTRDWHFQHDAGRPCSETSAELSGQFPAYASLIAAYGPRWLETIPGPVPGMIELVGELAASGVPLFAITNFSDEFWAMFRPTAPVFDHFRDIIVSGTEKVVKPDRPIFDLAMQRFGLAPGEALFVDDRADNVRGGESVGLIGHVFDSEPRLRARLVELGLL